MIPDRTWRRAVTGGVLLADLLVLFVSGAALPGFVPFALAVLAWAPGGPTGRPVVTGRARRA